MIYDVPAMCETCGRPDLGHPDGRLAVMYDHTDCAVLRLSRAMRKLGQDLARRRDEAMLTLLTGNAA